MEDHMTKTQHATWPLDDNHHSDHGVFEPFEFVLGEDELLTLETAVFQALGAASVCWSEMPGGVFESTRAREIGDKLVATIRQLTQGGTPLARPHSVDAHTVKDPMGTPKNTPSFALKPGEALASQKENGLWGWMETVDGVSVLVHPTRTNTLQDCHEAALRAVRLPSPQG